MSKQIFSYISLKIRQVYNFYNLTNRKMKYNDLNSLLKVSYIYEKINQLLIFLDINTLSPTNQSFKKFETYLINFWGRLIYIVGQIADRVANNILVIKMKLNYICLYTIPGKILVDIEIHSYNNEENIIIFDLQFYQ